MNVLFRCDGSAEIGAGHLVRCSALAREITRRGGQAALVCRPVSETMSWAIAGVMVLFVAPGARGRPLEGGSGLDQCDLRAFLDYAGYFRADWLFVDHYGAGASYLDAIADAGFRLAVVDDAGERDLKAADLLVNQNLGAESIRYRGKRTAAVCLGPRFALLRPEFPAARAAHAARRLISNPRRRVERVFVGFGGSRLAGFGAQIAAAIAAWDSGPMVTVAAGMDAASVARAMSEADLAIGAAGSTVWELCCLGVPSVVWPVAGNQEPIAAALAAAGAVVAVRGIAEALLEARDLIRSPRRRQALSRVAWNLVDGRGADRVFRQMAIRAIGADRAKVPALVSD